MFSGCVDEGISESSSGITQTSNPTSGPESTSNPTSSPSTDEPEVKGGYNVGVTAKQKEGDITVTYTGGPSHDHLDSVIVKQAGSATNVPNTFTGGSSDVKIGASVTFEGAGGSSRSRVIVDAKFKDGVIKTILDTNV